jgi:predicted O-methyltransferase YrrM
MDGPLPSNLVQCWEEFLTQPHNLEDLFAHPVLFPLQRKREMEAMHQVARELNPQVVMEIGADKGGSVWAWLHEIPTITAIIACEIRGTPYSEIMAKAFPHIQFLWLPESSYEESTLDKVLQWLGDKCIDVLFIDGDKSHFDTDYNLYQQRVNGVVFMHDVCDKPMKDAFLKCSRGKERRILRNVTEWTELKNNLPETPTAYQSWMMYWGDRSCTVGVIH